MCGKFRSYTNNPLLKHDVIKDDDPRTFLKPKYGPFTIRPYNKILVY